VYCALDETSLIIISAITLPYFVVIVTYLDIIYIAKDTTCIA